MMEWGVQRGILISLVMLIVWVPVVLYRYRRGRTGSIAHELLQLALAVYFLELIYYTIFLEMDQRGVFYFNLHPFRELGLLRGVNLVPFRSIRTYLPKEYTSGLWSVLNDYQMSNFYGNLMLFFPFGLLMPLVYQKKNSIFKTVAAAALLSACIEFVQLFVGRSTDIDDVILNTAGAALGYLVFALLRALWRCVQKIRTVKKRD